MVHQIDITQRGGKFNGGSHNSKKQNGYITKTSIPGCALTIYAPFSAQKNKIMSRKV